MIHLHSYTQFVGEKFATDPSDSEMLTSKKNTANQYEAWIKEFPIQSIKIETIFNDKNLDDTKRREKLKQLQLLKDPIKMIFKNELLQVWADRCSLQRKLTDLEEQIEKKKGEIDFENKQISSTGDADAIERSKGNIESTQSRLKDFEVDKKNLENQISLKEREKNQKMMKIKKDVENLKSQILTN